MATCQQMRPMPKNSTHPPIVQPNAPVPQPSLPDSAASVPTQLANGNYSAHAVGNIHATPPNGVATSAPAGVIAQPNGLLGSQPALLLDEQQRSNSAHFSSERSSQKLISPSGRTAWTNCEPIAAGSRSNNLTNQCPEQNTLRWIHKQAETQEDAVNLSGKLPCSLASVPGLLRWGRMSELVFLALVQGRA